MDTPQKFFTASHAIALPSGGEVPEWVHLIPAGVFYGRDGRGPYTLDAQAVLEAFAGWGADIVIDYEHQGLYAPQNGQPAPAAGWVKQLESRADGIWGRVEWVPRAASMIASREYRYSSPVFDHTDDGRVFRLIAVGLTNGHNLYLTALNRRTANSLTTSSHAKGGAMDINELLERLRYMLNLPTLATADQVLAELDKLKTLVASPTTQAMRQSLALPATAGIADLLTAAHARIGMPPDATQFVPRVEYERVANALGVMQKAGEDARVESAVTAAMAAGKVAPASAEWARQYCRADPKGFEAFVASAPVMIPGAHVASHAAQVHPEKPQENPLIADAQRRAAGQHA